MIEIAYASSAPAKNMSVNSNAWDAIWQASPIVQVTLLILIGLSIVCWAVAFSKYNFFKSLIEENDRFAVRFYKATSLDSLYEDIETFKNSSLARIFKAGYVELKQLAERKSGAPAGGLLVSGADNLERTLRKATDNELSFMESRLTILASTGSTGPFIGLFGTVWGIMNSFHKIGQTGSASLAVVAPGISEALVATAIGLAAAIPAVVLYNHFISQIKKEEMALNSFSSDFLNMAKRNFFKE